MGSCCGLRQVNLAIYQGDDWAALVTVNNCDGTPADLTGYLAQAQIRTGPADQTWAVAAEILSVVVPPSQISISLANYQTALLDQVNYAWDLQVVSPTGIITTILAGQVNVTPEITRELEVMPVVVETAVWAVGETRWRIPEVRR